MGDAARTRDLRVYVPLLLTLLAGMILTAGITLGFRAQEEARLKADFQSMAADRAQVIRSALGEDQLELALLADYVSASTELSRGDLGPFVQEFGRLARRVMLHEDDMQVIGFIPAVSGEDRTSFETTVRRNVDAGFIVREMASGSVRPAGRRPRYFPIAVMAPEQYSGGILGLDLATVPGLQQSLEHSISSGRSTASAAQGQPLSASGLPVVWNFRAVHRAARASDAGAGQTGMVGLCVTAVRVDKMVEQSLTQMSPAGIDLELRDGDAPGKPVLYLHRSDERGGTEPRGAGAGMRWTTTIDAGERAWILTAYPTADFISRHRSWQTWTILAGGLLLTFLGGGIVWGRLRRAERVESEVAQRTLELGEQVAKHQSLERALAESRVTLTAQVAQLNEKNRQIQLLGEMGDALQACLTVEEAFATVSLHSPLLLPGTSGMLFVHDPLRNLFSVAAEWGKRPPGLVEFKAEDCWALRRGKPHAVTDTSANLPCPHMAGESRGHSLCIPLAAVGKTIGLLYVSGEVQSLRAFAESNAEHLALALANLRLRADLRELSIHDPLTGLYNRRYMEEALETELRRAERKQHPISLIMLDIDHFKAFNDGFGHAAGDQMLRAIGMLVLSRVRSADIACRYGGEELLLILPEADAHAAAQKAEELRQGAQLLQVSHQDTRLGQVTISLGVSAYPIHARTREELLTAADASLYRAKQAGRDRVVVYGPELRAEEAATRR